MSTNFVNKFFQQILSSNFVNEFCQWVSSTNFWLFCTTTLVQKFISIIFRDAKQITDEKRKTCSELEIKITDLDDKWGKSKRINKQKQDKIDSLEKELESSKASGLIFFFYLTFLAASSRNQQWPSVCVLEYWAYQSRHVLPWPGLRFGYYCFVQNMIYQGIQRSREQDIWRWQSKNQSWAIGHLLVFYLVYFWLLSTPYLYHGTAYMKLPFAVKLYIGIIS